VVEADQCGEGAADQLAGPDQQRLGGRVALVGGGRAAETTMLRGGAGRRIERWFYELGTEGGLVDVPAFVAALREQAYDGWVVVESDHGGNPAELAMLNSWYVQHELAVPRRQLPLRG
jgi:hypothetical protein